MTSLTKTALEALPLIPDAHPEPFRIGIRHPDLWLWDSWCYAKDGEWHLYCLALSKTDGSGNTILPHDRNDYQFHIRHFIGTDNGQSWKDVGVFQTPGVTPNGYYDRNIWSGSALPLSENRIAFGFTGIREVAADRPFLQSIGLAISMDGMSAEHIQPEPLSCPLRDYDMITSLGYYLGPKDILGHNIGEEGGPILAWRDPFLFQVPDGSLQAVWSAKKSPTEGVMAHATLIETETGFEIETLHPPVSFKDSDLFTQAEVPKIYFDTKTTDYFCVLAACDRLYEGQNDYEVSKVTRLYRADSLKGPWAPYKKSGSRLPGLTHLFGGSIIEVDFSARVMTMLAPYTEMADDDIQLTFAPPIKIDF